MKKIKISINTKMILLILSVTAFIYIVSMVNLMINMKRMALRDAHKIADASAREYANLAEANFNVDMNMSRALAHSFIGMNRYEPSLRIKIQNRILKNILENNSDFLATWLIWEMNAVDSNYTKPFGRVRYTYVRDASKQVFYKEEILDTLGDNTEGAYYKMKMSKQETIMNPYTFSYTGEDTILETSICAPILYNGNFAGLVGVDLLLSRFQMIIDQIKPFERSQAFLIAHDGTIVAHPQIELIGKNISNTSPQDNKKFKILENIQIGIPFNIETFNQQDKETQYTSFAPINIGNSKTPWAIGIAVPENVILAEANQKLRLAVIIGIIGLLLLTVIVLIIARSISRPLKRTTEVLKKLSAGDITDIHKLKVNTKDEIGDMASFVNSLIDGLGDTAKFAETIGQGNLESTFKPLSEKDVLGNSLLKMRENLKEAKEKEELRKLEDQQRNWMTHGLAKFSELLRLNNDNIETLSYQIIYNLLQYLDMKVGAMYLINNEDQFQPYLYMSASYAYDRKRTFTKRIEIGEGLVGSCFKEKRFLVLDNVPEDYLSVSSGLGETWIRTIIDIPLVSNDEIFGVIELGDIKKIDDFKKDFLEKVAESIASTINAVNINLRTAKLLEQSQIQSERLRAQEEEMRQNMEELHATQEEISKNNAEMTSMIEAINAANLVIVYDLTGQIIDINDSYLKVFNIADKSNVIGGHHRDNLDIKADQEKEYHKFWNDLQNGKIKKQITKVNYLNKELWFDETYTPIKDSKGIPFKIMKISHDITEIKSMEKTFKEKLSNFELKENELIEKCNKLEEENRSLKNSKKK